MFTVEPAEITLDTDDFEKNVRYHEGAIAYTTVGGEDSSYDYVDLTVNGEIVPCSIQAVLYEYAEKAFVLLTSTRGDQFYLVTYKSGETGAYDKSRGAYWLVQAQASFSQSDNWALSPSLLEAISQLHAFAASSN